MKKQNIALELKFNTIIVMLQTILLIQRQIVVFVDALFTVRYTFALNFVKNFAFEVAGK